MKEQKIYATLANAYAAAEKANASHFDLTYNGGMVLGVLERTYKSRSAITVAKNNLVRYEKTLCALECVKGGFKWTAVGTFDNEGLLYPVVNAPAVEEKPTKATRTRKPKATKGNGIDFKAFKGTVSEKNKALHAELVSRGIKDSRTDEYKAVWQARPWAKA